jgi:hypothetical protein
MQAQWNGITCFGVTLGLRSCNTGPLNAGGPVLDPSGGFMLASGSGVLHEWEPFVALTFAFEPRDPGSGH